MVFPLTIISGLGLAKIANRKLFFMGFMPVLLFFVIYYLDLFYVHARFYSAVNWLYAYKPALEIVNKNQADYDKIVFTDEFGQPYIFVLFYSRFDPRKYQLQAKLTESPVGDVGFVSGFDKYTFENIYWPSRRNDKSTMFVGGQYELPDQDLYQDNLVHLGKVNYPNGQPALRIVGLK